MNYRFRKPKLIPSLAVILAFALMSALGVWQLERLQWKTALLADIAKAQAEPPRNLLSYSAQALPEAEWHNALATGTFLYDKELYATPRYLEGQMGYAILTPLAITTPSGTQYVIVNRGWVPPEKKDPLKRAGGNVAGSVIVEGVIRSRFKQAMFRPDNEPAKNLWFWYDLPAMQKQVGLPLLPVMIDATRIRLATGAAIKNAPVPFPVEITLRNDHLGYAITWFLIGLSAVAMFVISHLEKKK